MFVQRDSEGHIIAIYSALQPGIAEEWVENPELWVPPPTDEELAYTARAERDKLFRGVYDPGITMALRALRMASTPEQTSYAEGKVSELDLYAEALVAIPDQLGFPQTIVWPVAPTK